MIIQAKELAQLHEALDAIDAQLIAMRSLKGWRLNLIRENLAKARGALPAFVETRYPEGANVDRTCRPVGQVKEP